MKYVHVAILAFLVVIAGLLVGIYQTQHSTATSAENEAEGLFEPAQARPESQRQPVSPGTAVNPVEPVTKRAARPVEPKPDPRTARVEPRSTPAEPPATQQEAPEVQDPKPASEPEIVPPQPASAPVPTPPEPEPRQPRTVTLPANMPIVVRLVDALSTDTNYPGDTFYAALDEEIMLDGLLVARKGANVEGRVLESQRAGRVKGVSMLSLELVRLSTADGQTVEVVTTRAKEQGPQSQKSDAKKVGLGAAIGAAIGAIAGGGKGAAIGAGAGAGAGAGTVLTTRGKPVKLPSETRLEFQLMDPVQVVEAL